MDPLFSTPRSTVLLDRKDELLGATTAADGQWRFPARGDVPERFVVCITQFEDRHFFEHHGVRLQSLVRAARQNQRAGRTVSGGSTLTMQLARMSRGPSHRSYVNKLVEALIALRIELRNSKQEILALYAANAPFGGNVVGLDAAAWRWFGRSPDQLTWSECATLAVLPNAPSALYPGKGDAALRAKRDRLLDRLHLVGTLDDTEWSLAREEPLPGKPHALPMLAPHLLTTLRNKGRSGERITSTLSAPMQSRAMEICEHYAPRLRANEVHNAAALIIDVASGEVRAYVGNLPSCPADKAGHVDIVRAHRSTGSLLKPFLYADMLQSGELLPDMLVADVPTQYEGFAPRNFDEHFSGAVPASVALARSLNVPAVRGLRRHGVDRTLQTLRAMGLTSIDQSAAHYGLALIMGGAECSLWELGGAYASMARVLDNYGRGGTRYRGSDIHPPLVIATTARPTDTAEPAVPPLTAASIFFTLKALSEVDRPTDEQGWKSFAHSERIAWKTGTSMGHRDAWAIGVSDRWCVAVWTGNASGEGRPGLTGTLAAAPLMFDLFGLLPAGQGSEAPEEELVSATLCPRSGHLAGVECPVGDTARVPAPGLRTPVCPYHRTIHVDATQRWRVPAGEGTPVPWFVLSPSMERYYAVLHPDHRHLPPLRSGESDEVAMEVLYPDAGARLLIPTELDGSRGKAVIEAAHRDPHAHVHWDLDGTFLGTTLSDHRMALDPPDGPHKLTLTDDHGRSIRHSFVVVSRDQR